VPLIGAANRPASPPPPGSFRRRLAQTASQAAITAAPCADSAAVGGEEPEPVVYSKGVRLSRRCARG
jgi:hypothetical protein